MTVFLGLAVASISAQTQSTASSSTSYIETSKFVGKKVKSAQGDEIGTVKDIMLDRNTGCLAYTVVSTSGGGDTRVGGGGKMVAVPWAVYSPSSDLNVLTVTVDRDRIYNAPVFDYARIDEYSRPEYITNVYSYYGVSSGAAVGVGVSGSTTTGVNTTTAGNTTTGAATTHPTASPSTRGRETGTPPSRRTRGATDTGSHSETERSQPEGSHQPESNTGTRESRPDTGQSDADQSSSAERTTGTHHREKTGKRETSSPPERPEGQ